MSNDSIQTLTNHIEDRIDRLLNIALANSENYLPMAAINFLENKLNGTIWAVLGADIGKNVLFIMKQNPWIDSFRIDFDRDERGNHRIGVSDVIIGDRNVAPDEIVRLGEDADDWLGSLLDNSHDFDTLDAPRDDRYGFFCANSEAIHKLLADSYSIKDHESASIFINRSAFKGLLELDEADVTESERRSIDIQAFTSIAPTAAHNIQCLLAPRFELPSSLQNIGQDTKDSVNTHVREKP